MAKQTLTNEHTEFTIQHRAVCEDDNFRGSWRSDISQARQDARNHRSMPGNENHVIRIVTQQTLSMTFIDE
jgi:hypothetical protein